MKHIYTITVMECDKERQQDVARLYGQRCMGWFPDLGRAIKAVEANEGGLDESLYDFAVIELVEPGIQRIAEQIQWFWWEIGKPSKWVKCQAPRCVTLNGEIISTVNWSIG